MGQDQVSARTQHPRDLCRGGPGVELGDEVKVLLGIGKVRRPPDLKCDPPLGVESNPRYRPPDKRLGGIDAANPGAGKLTGEIERRVALTTADHQDSFRRSCDGQRGRGQRCQGWQRQAAIIATCLKPLMI